MKSKVHAWLTLGTSAVMLWFFFAIVSPWLISYSSAWQRFIAVQDEYNIHSGAIFYTDVPTSAPAEAASRAAVRKAYLQQHKPS